MARLGETRSSAPPARPTTPHAVARWCAAQGWPVHPLAPGRKTPAANCPACKDQQHDPKLCPCPSAGRPCHSFHAATTNPQYIDSWWTASPGAGVGVACGSANLVVIDIDAHSALVPDRTRLLPGISIPEVVNLTGLASGFDTLALLAAFRQQPDPASDDTTLRVRTPSGGLHIWYRNSDPAVRFRCSTGSSPKVALAWQVDVRAEGGYIIAPTTRTGHGIYQAEGPTRIPAPLPDWLRTELVRTGHVIAPKSPQQPGASVLHRRRRPRKPGAAPRALAALAAEVAQCEAVPEGAGFTEKLNRAAYTAGGLVAAGHLDEAMARDLLLESANRARPWQTARNEKLLQDGLSAGATRPFHLEGRS
ncbi:bifunctional DNA primase/polymerase [Streptomyces sp. AK02-04a]|uniref:bifunctional DNA primase/polymerase n=1 Tax=Streptomyces sp. AK02-04a TaxID=3028649 RepID=UPI0029B5FFE6|nr:bifunctional DNA primase/polymerase [Streptomyces sp. AK02-04a]MDX3762797.1 bifunctional DNA primase/polymerase [Streptomyces sp. AK02-04a]